jgi:hypothetical protein
MSSSSFTGAPGILLSGGTKLHLRVMDAVMRDGLCLIYDAVAYT